MAVCILYFNNKKKMEEKREEAAKTRKCVRSKAGLSMAGMWHSKGRVSRDEPKRRAEAAL